MDPELEKRIARLAADRESGASEILDAAIAALREAIAVQADLPEVASALRRAQPSMAPIWNATAAALNGDLDLFARRVARAPQAIARFAVEVLEIGLAPGAALRSVTLSYSGTVAHVLEALARRRPVSVACSESRPALEGRRLASRLAAEGVPVSFYSDAAIGRALDETDVVLVGADAVNAQWFVNKSGTGMLAAAAAHQGVPVYVLAGREKFLSKEAAATLPLRDGAAEEIWSPPPPGVLVHNPYFERIPLALITGIVTDAGVFGPEERSANG